MYKYAEVKHGKIIKLYDDERLLEDFVALFSNETFFLDVTEIQCDVGWIVELDENLCITNLKPPTKEVNKEVNEEVNEELKTQEQFMYKEPIEISIYNDINRADYYELIINMYERIEKLEEKLKEIQEG